MCWAVGDESWVGAVAGGERGKWNGFRQSQIPSRALHRSVNVRIQIGSDIDSVLHICIVCVCVCVFHNRVARVHSLKWIVLQNWQNKLQLLCYSWGLLSNVVHWPMSKMLLFFLFIQIILIRCKRQRWKSNLGKVVQLRNLSLHFLA